MTDRPVFRVVIDVPLTPDPPVEGLEDLTAEAIDAQLTWYSTELHRAFEGEQRPLRGRSERIGDLLAPGRVMSVEVVEETFDPRYDT